MPDLQFNDYTKRTAIVEKAKSIPNYHVTFSYSAKSRYAKHVETALQLGSNLAVIFRNKELPEFFLGLPVINGDLSDLRFTDNEENKSQVIVGLYAKGKMKKDTSGMVIDNENLIAMA